MAQQWRVFETEIVERVRLPYLAYTPEDYGRGTHYPLLLFLHGKGERGDDLELLKKHGLPKLIGEGHAFPFIIVAPQCPTDRMWIDELEGLNTFLDNVLSIYQIDTHRVYLTGLSMGGFGTWAWAARSPQRFAAIAPICGGGDPAAASTLKTIPAWVFHGAKDTIVPLSESQKMVDALRACGSNVKFTVYPDAEHNSWSQTYDNPALYDWFLSQRR